MLQILILNGDGHAGVTSKRPPVGVVSLSVMAAQVRDISGSHAFEVA